MAADGATVGPVSVGFGLTERARVFGGETLTATDIAVAAGLIALGDASRVADLDPAVVATARGVMRDRIADLVDSLKTDAAPATVIGGQAAASWWRADLGVARAAACRTTIALARSARRSPRSAARWTASTRSMGAARREAALAAARAEDRRDGYGSDPATIEIVEVDEIPLTYLPSNALRVRVKVVGDLLEQRWLRS
ncbi:MAG: hypothetical protein U0841_04255 [Chloroflexia bacterium]